MELNSIEETKNLSKKISKIVKNGDIIFLYGEIGVGKTTFVRYLINYLEEVNDIKKSEILSPTFSIIHDYKIKKIKILHCDLYRLKSYNDILELGMFETAENYIKIIEWPKLIQPKPQNRIEIALNYSKFADSRRVKITGFGKWKDYKFDEI